MTARLVVWGGTALGVLGLVGWVAALLGDVGELKQALVAERAAGAQCHAARLDDASRIYDLETANASSAYEAASACAASGSGSFQSGYETGLAVCGAQ